MSTPTSCNLCLTTVSHQGGEFRRKSARLTRTRRQSHYLEGKICFEVLASFVIFSWVYQVSLLVVLQRLLTQGHDCIFGD